MSERTSEDVDEEIVDEIIEQLFEFLSDDGEEEFEEQVIQSTADHFDGTDEEQYGWLEHSHKLYTDAVGKIRKGFMKGRNYL